HLRVRLSPSDLPRFAANSLSSRIHETAEAGEGRAGQVRSEQGHAVLAETTRSAGTTDVEVIVHEQMAISGDVDDAGTVDDPALCLLQADPEASHVCELRVDHRTARALVIHDEQRVTIQITERAQRAEL